MARAIPEKTELQSLAEAVKSLHEYLQLQYPDEGIIIAQADLIGRRARLLQAE